MKKGTWAALGGLAAAAFLTAPGYLPREKRRLFSGLNFAHRGLHTPDRTVPENSLTAFRLAAEQGYGVELDVQLSRDGQVVVFHDRELKRVCGVDGKVDDYPYEELKKLRLCGTEEGIPLFSQVLELYAGAGPMVVELKPCPRRRELCEKTWELLKDYKGRFCVESFDPRIIAWFRFHQPQVVRGQLAMEAKKYPSKGQGLVLSRTLLNCLARPQFIAYDVDSRKPLAVRLCEAMGALKMGWTVREDDPHRGFDSLIFEFCRPGPSCR